MPTIPARLLAHIAFLAWTALAAAGEGAPSPTEILEDLRSATLDPAGAVRVRNLDLDLSGARLVVRDGWVVPATAVAGRPRELVLVGSATFHLDPGDPIEAQQVRLFTGATRIAAEVRSMVLVPGNDDLAGRVLTGEPGDPAPEQVELAEDLFRAWGSGPQRKRFGMEAALVRAAQGEPAASRLVGAWCPASAVGPFLYVVDPDDPEPVTLGQFVPLELGDNAKTRLKKRIRREQRRGRFSHIRFQDLGDWDTWYSGPARTASRVSWRGSRGFEPERYTLDVTIERKTLELAGTATLDLVATEVGRGAVLLNLFADLRATAVRDGAGRDLTWIQNGIDLTVFLPEPVTGGGRLRLTVDYRGQALQRLGGSEAIQRSTTYWYPHAGTLDRATYDVRLRWPKGLDLLAGGVLADEGRDGDYRWERRVLDIPSDGFSFEIGKYDVLTEQVGHVSVRVGIARSPDRISPTVIAEVVETVAQALGFYEDVFGPYPLDHITVATVRRGFSQGNLSFVTLAQAYLRDQRYTDQESRLQRSRIETIAHEVAHQWWGNLVGWAGYRDQWLSEALAEYSEVLFAYRRLGRPSSYHETNVQGRLSTLLERADNGRKLQSMGPVVLGTRLHSSLSDNAFRAVVYDKGFLVLWMLAEEIGPDRFLDALGDLNAETGYGVLETASFLRSLERKAAVDLGPFARRFVFGIGIPEVFHRWSTDPLEDGGHRLRIEARQFVTEDDGARIVRTEKGWDALRREADRLDAAAAGLSIPVQAELEDGRLWGGTLALDGATRVLEIDLPSRPLAVRLDPGQRILARFHDEVVSPKRSLHERAAIVSRIGRVEEGEALYRQALDTPFGEDPEISGLTPRELKVVRARYDARILYGLTDLLLDLGRTEEARAAMAEADRLLDGPDRGAFQGARLLLESRLLLREGNAQEAYAQMKRLRLEIRQQNGESAADALRRMQYRRGWTGTGRDYALLAMGALQIGREEVFVEAAREARRRGADLGPFLEGFERSP